MCLLFMARSVLLFRSESSGDPISLGRFNQDLANGLLYTCAWLGLESVCESIEFSRKSNQQ